jgi:ABC-2 type transport system ATP-binding protein
VTQSLQNTQVVATEPGTGAAVEVADLVKRYPKAETNAVDGVSLTVRRGEVFGLLGPNGAGKTTLLGILTTAVAPTSGVARVAGIDVRDVQRVKPRIAVLPQINNLDRSLRAREVLTFHAAYHGVPRAEREARADRLLEDLGLAERAKEKVPRYSGGMAQRLMLARALMHDPEVLFLDEPTNNLDPQTRHFLWERIRTLHQQGITIVLTTHDMNEAESLCDRVAIVDHGKVLVLDTPDALKRQIPGGLIEVDVALAAEGTSGDDVADRLRALAGVERVDRAGAEEDAGLAAFRVYSQNAVDLVPHVIRTVTEQGATVRDLRVSTPSLETVFIHMTGRNLRA